MHNENFVSIRTLHPRVTWRPVSRYAAEAPSSSVEIDYRDLLSEANEDFFHREYPIALQNYLSLRQKILVQSHPELPRNFSLADILGSTVSAVATDRIFELARRHLVAAKPGGPIRLSTSEAAVIPLATITPNPAFAQFAGLGLDAGVVTAGVLESSRELAREHVLANRWTEASELYAEQAELAEAAGEHRLSAELHAERASVLATYADADRPAALREAGTAFQAAAQLYTAMGDTSAVQAMQANLMQLDLDRDGDRPQRPDVRPPLAPGASVRIPGGELLLGNLIAAQPALGAFEGFRQPARGGPAIRAGVRAAMPKPVSKRAYLVPEGDMFKTSAALVTGVATRPAEQRSVGLLAGGAPVSVSLASANFQGQLVDLVYKDRIEATTLEAIYWSVIVDTTFVAYIPHLYFYVLPLAIGDTYLALGRYQRAIDEYRSALAYPYLNAAIEVPDLWRRIAAVYLRWGDDLFRRGQSAAARGRYEQIILTDLTIPAGSPLYQPSKFATVRDQVGEVAKKLGGQPFGVVNPKLAQQVTAAYTQLTKITAGLNYLGLSDDHYPVQRFKYLQAAANFLADQAIQAERTYIQFRNAAEQQKMEHLQLANAVRVNEVALKAEDKRLVDAALDRLAAQRTRELSEVRRQNARDALTEWDTTGRELTSLNAALAWAGNAANDQDITYTGVRYHGESHDYSGDVEDFFDTVGEVREWLNFDLQRNRIVRQMAESEAEVAITQVREVQAAVRVEIQQLNRELAAVRLEGAREILDYAEDRTFDEDLWFRLAGELRDLAGDYLDMAIHAAFLMERAYDLEYDRDLQIIRLDYGAGTETEGLLGGDYLKRDIASFTIDELQHAEKQNPLRMVLSLRGEFPQAFNTFQAQGILAFRTDLEIFDRRFPGSYRRKLKRVEVFVEGLAPPEGVHGRLRHGGLSTEWRRIGGAWQKHTRALPADDMVLSSYQFRRDIAVFQPSEELLGLFENVGPQGDWTLELPRSANDLEYESISDIKLALYFDTDHDETLETHVKAFYPATGGRSLVLSSRFHYPDQYFRLDADRAVAFTLAPARFAYNHEARALEGMTVRLIPVNPAVAIGAQELTISRESDGASVTATTDADGVLAGDPATMAPLSVMAGGDPADVWTVALGAGADTSAIGDVQLAMSYTFTYRADGSL